MHCSCLRICWFLSPATSHTLIHAASAHERKRYSFSPSYSSICHISFVHSFCSLPILLILLRSLELIYLLLPCLLFKYLHSIRLKYISKKFWRNRNLHDSFAIESPDYSQAYAMHTHIFLFLFLDCQWTIR